ncbi:MAG: hypothetical protein ACOYO1_15260 [Bacteroidales bacterium]
MKTIKNIFLSLILFCLIFSCSTVEKISTEKKTTVSLQIGSNMGGITENTDMRVVPGVKVPAESNVDAFTGATHPGFNAGVHINYRLKKNQVETGLDYMYNFQNLNYIDVGNKYIGLRELHVSQFMVPVTYNFVFQKARLQLKVGLLSQFNLVSVKGYGFLPDYSVIPFSAGPTFGVSFLPFHFHNADKLGIYCDIYRGSQIYKDFYNQSEFEIPGSSFIKFGFKYQLH